MLKQNLAKKKYTTNGVHSVKQTNKHGFENEDTHTHLFSLLFYVYTNWSGMICTHGSKDASKKNYLLHSRHVPIVLHTLKTQPFHLYNHNMQYFISRFRRTVSFFLPHFRISKSCMHTHTIPCLTLLSASTKSMNANCALSCMHVEWWNHCKLVSEVFLGKRIFFRLPQSFQHTEFGVQIITLMLGTSIN